MARIDTDPKSWHAASQVFGSDIADALTCDYQTLQGALSGTSGMAGTDPARVDWGGSYDKAIDQLTGVTQDLINGCYKMAALLEATGLNHGRADSASIPGGTVTTDTNNYAGWEVFLGGLTHGSGSHGSSTPPGWWLIEHTVGYVWPNGDPGTLRAAASSWSTAAQAITGAASVVDSANGAIYTEHSPEVANAVAACEGMRSYIADLSSSYNDISSACTEYAKHIEDAHQQAIEELESLVAWTVGIETAGAIVGAFTFGIGEGGAQAVELARIAKTASRVAEIIGDLIEAAGAVARTIVTAVARALGISRDVAEVLAVDIAESSAEGVEALPAGVDTAAGDAVEDLAADAEADATAAGKTPPKSSPNFEPPTNAPQEPPTDLPQGWSVREMPPTKDYPDGYWVETNEYGQPVDPSTGKPPSNVTRPQARARTHVPLPPK